MSDRAREVLQRIYGYEDFRGEQAGAIAAALGGRDSVVLMPTGGGKSLCYQIPPLVADGCALVVSPLIALMHDQVQALGQLGVAAGCLNSAQSAREDRTLTIDGIQVTDVDDSRVSLITCSNLNDGRCTVTDLTDFSVSMWEPTYDTECWKIRKQLHLFLQKVEQGDGEHQRPLAPQMVSVLEAQLMNGQ